MTLNRRGFLGRSLAAPGVISLAGGTPAILQTAGAWAQENNSAETVLVVVQLSGGNDGLNTLAPVSDPRYRAARPTLAVSKEDGLTIDDAMAWHPAARGFADLMEDGRLCAVQNVGYPDPNRSHFESMDIWHSCQRKEQREPNGWLGRFLDRKPAGQDAPAMHLGDKKLPLALSALKARAATVRSLDQFRLKTNNDEELKASVEKLAKTNRDEGGLLGFVQSSTESALQASQRVERARQSYKTDVAYPESTLAQKLKTVAQLIDAQLDTRIYYVDLDGFDTHSRQAPAHEALLSELSGAVQAFVNDLDQHGHGKRVLTMCFSEFGRRVQENASEGTDHGAAGPMFLAGHVQPGLHGRRPKLDKLQKGDLQFAIDFRRVYATVLDEWLGAPSDKILRGDYQPLPLLKSV